MQNSPGFSACTRGLMHCIKATSTCGRRFLYGFGGYVPAHAKTLQRRNNDAFRVSQRLVFIGEAQPRQSIKDDIESFCDLKTCERRAYTGTVKRAKRNVFVS